jgi:hypothetical protein
LIEDGMVDQHEGSVAVGKLLKELYVDSMKKQRIIVAGGEDVCRAVGFAGRSISWSWNWWAERW